MTRLESLYSEWNRIAAEMLQTCEQMKQQDADHAERMRVVTREAINECDKLLERLS
jgi:hypothetical protein